MSARNPKPPSKLAAENARLREMLACVARTAGVRCLRVELTQKNSRKFTLIITAPDETDERTFGELFLAQLGATGVEVKP